MSKFTPTQKHVVLLEVWTSKENKDLTDMIAQRAYTLGGVEMAEARLLATIELDKGEVK